MRVLVLGGCGLQGRAALFDLSRSPQVTEIICADAATGSLGRLQARLDMAKIKLVPLDASRPEELAALMAQRPDAVIDLLPRPFMLAACRAAVAAGRPIVTTNYGHDLRPLHAEAQARGAAIMPECGLDPGIDLVLYGRAARYFDRLTRLNSYCGGIPEKKACDNPLNYKISWNWAMVLASSVRDSVVIKDGRRHFIAGMDQHANPFIHGVDFPGLGPLEAIPNGDAAFFVDQLGLGESITETGRYSLRWPGWSALLDAFKKLGFFEETPIPGLGVSPRQVLVKHLEPRLQYGADEKDLAPMLNVFAGVKDGRRERLTVSLLIERDLETGLLAMNLGVGYTASIAAQMLAQGEIKATGVLSPALDIPAEPFLAGLKRRGIVIHERLEVEG